MTAQERIQALHDVAARLEARLDMGLEQAKEQATLGAGGMDADYEVSRLAGGLLKVRELQARELNALVAQERHRREQFGLVVPQ